MKKLKLSISNLKGAELLTREELKKVMGGSDGTGSAMCKWGACTLSIQGSDGSWVTLNGSCTYAMPWTTPGTCYCDAGLGIVPVTSNGGSSRCNP